MAKYYTDIDLRFKLHPLTKDIGKLEDDDAVKNSIKNIVLTNKNEKRFNNEFGGNVRSYLFEEIDFIVSEVIKQDITDLIYRYESRVENVIITNLSDISADTLSFTIQYNIINIPLPQTLDLIVRKLR